MSTKRGSMKQSAQIMSLRKNSASCFEMQKWSEQMYWMMQLKQSLGTPETRMLPIRPEGSFFPTSEDSLKAYFELSIEAKYGHLVLSTSLFALMSVSSTKNNTSQKSSKFLHWFIWVSALLWSLSCLSSGLWMCMSSKWEKSSITSFSNSSTRFLMATWLHLAWFYCASWLY